MDGMGSEWVVAEGGANHGDYLLSRYGEAIKISVVSVGHAF